MPIMNHWKVSHTHVSLRDIIKEEEARHQTFERARQSQADLDRLFSLFLNTDKNFLRDNLRDHNYSLTKTEEFLRCLPSKEPVKTVFAPETPRPEHHRESSKERKQELVESVVQDYQDSEDPEYFRAEAALQRKRQRECLSKAAEAYRQGRKESAYFYAQ